MLEIAVSVIVGLFMHSNENCTCVCVCVCVCVRACVRAYVCKVLPFQNIVKNEYYMKNMPFYWPWIGKSSARIIPMDADRVSHCSGST